MRIILVEDHQMFRDVLRKVCRELNHDIIAEAEEGTRAVELITRLRPDFILLDLQLPGLDGFGIIEATHKASPDTRILVLSSHCDDVTVYRLEHAGVQGFIDKNTNTVTALRDAIRAVASGKPCFSEAFQRIKQKRHDDPRSFDKVLGDRERTIVSMLAIPLVDAEIARRLGISRETVEKHRLNILRKLDLRTTLELMRYAREHGFVLSSP